MAATMNSGIGASVLRKEDAPLITGEGRYVDDIKLPGMAYAAFVRSPHAHAVVKRIDTSAAEGMPGVVKVITHATLGLEAGVPCASNPFGNAAQPKRPILAEGKVRMVGELVALVVAESQATARDAADRVEVEYEPLPVVIDAENAGKPGAPQLHDEAPSNHCLTIEHKTEGFDAVFDAAPVKVSLTIDNQRLTAVPIEPRGVVADWISSSGELTFYTSTQVPHFVRTFVAAICGIPESKVRVVAPDVGGGFGSKIDVYAEEFAIAQASRLSGRPVKWIETRTEHMVSTVAGRDQLQTATLAADKDGRILALKVHLLQDCGAYLGLLTPSIAHLTVIMIPGAYAVQHVDITLDEVFTNTVPTDAYRGAGRPEAAHLIERLVDRLADELELDPAEVRRLNFATEFPYTTATGLVYDSGDYAKAMDLALEMSDYSGFEARRKASAARGNHRGIGLSTWVEICGLAPSAVTKAIGIGAGGWESAIVRLHPTGSVTVVTGSSAHGQGHETSWSQIVESELGIPFEQVDVVHGDTGQSPYGLGTYGSRSLAVGGTALQLTCEKVRDKARLIAAHLLECSADDLEWSAGQWQVKGSPERAKTIQELAYAAWAGDSMPTGVEPNLEATTFYDPPNFTFPFGTHIAEVEIDGETGKIVIERYTAVDDCGNVINPMIVEGQVHGGIVQSIAQALYEETVYDENGQNLTGTLVDYLVPSAAEMPRMDSARTVTPSPSNPMGVKGIGEAGTIAASCGRRQRRGGCALGARCPAPRDADAAGARVGGHSAGEGGQLMIPEAFTYERAGSVAEALEHMGQGALPLAGGHSLVPALKLRLSAPEALVDIARIPELSGIRVEGGALVIGATTRHRVVAESAEVKANAAALAAAALSIGDQQVRNRGTIGGSLAQADPHGDLPAVALALGAEIVAQSASGTRTIAADDFFVDYYTTALEEGELITAIRIPGGQSQGAYAKFSRRAQDWAIIAAAASKGQGGWRVGLCGAAATAVRARGVEEALASGASPAEASKRASEGIEPSAGLDGSTEYKRHLATVMVRRALEAAGA